MPLADELQLREYLSSIRTNNVCAVGILGTIACVAAGALDNSQDVTRNSYFLTLLGAAALMGGSRFYTEWRMARLKRRIDGKSIPAFKPPKYSLLQRAYFHFVISVLAIYSVGFVFLLGFAFQKDNLLAKDPGIWVIVVISSSAFVCVLFLLVALQNDRNTTSSQPTLLELSDCEKKELNRFLKNNRTCRAVTTVCDDKVKRINLTGLVLAAQITCVGGGALRPDSGIHFAAFFLAISIFALYLAHARLIHEKTALSVQREVKVTKTLTWDADPNVEEIIEFVRCNPRAVWYALVVPPLILAYGIVSVWLSWPDEAAIWVYALAGIYFVWADCPVRTWVLPNTKLVGVSV